jgi:hypothetical protein
LPNNNLIIYTDAATDPYSDSSEGQQVLRNLELQENLSATITDAGYDIVIYLAQMVVVETPVG